MGTGAAFDLHEDVPTAISTLDSNDRFVVSDENLSGDPNRYATLESVAAKLAGSGLTAASGVLSASAGAIAELDSTRAYAKGEQAWTGTGAAFTVWTANQAISANSTTPTRELPQNWIVESGPGSIRGLLSPINVNALRVGDIFWHEEISDAPKVYFTRTAGNYSSTLGDDPDDFIELTVAANRLIPSGGTAGQVLTKASGTDYDVAWEDVAGGAGGGSGSFARTTILDAATVSTSAWTEVTLTETLATGAILEVVAAEDTSGSNSGTFSPAFISSAELLSQATGVSVAPTNGVGSASLKIHSPTGTDGNEFGHDTIRIRLSDEGDKLWVRSARTAGTFNRLSIHKLLPTGGGAEAPGGEQSDDSIAGVAGVFDETTIDVPSGTWGFVNFGDIGEHFSGEWHRFLVADLTGQTASTDGAAVTDTNSLMFVANEEHYFFLGHTSAGKVLVGASADDITPSSVRIRSN